MRRTARHGSTSALRQGTSCQPDGAAWLGAAPSPISGSTAVDVDTWLYDVRGAIGFTEYRPTRVAWPYGFVGLGGITYDLKRPVSPPLTFITRSPTLDSRGNPIIITDDGRQLLLSLDELGTEPVFAVNFGLGTDFRVPLGPGGVGLRLEVSDHVASSPLGLRVRELSPFGGLVSDAGVGFGLVHHLSATAGLVVQIGR
jgi:hypothetical protein